MNRNVVYFGGAAALGIVAYAWYRNSQEGPAILTSDPNVAPVGEPRDSTGFTISSSDAGTTPQNNAEWRDLAVSKLIATGLDGSAVSSAIGKYIGRQPLSKTEQDLVRQALLAAGDPPQGGPYSIIEIASGGVQPALTRPLNLTANMIGGGQVVVSWDAVAGAVKYAVRADVNGVRGGTVYEDQESHVSGPWPEAQGRTVVFVVSGVNGSGVIGPESTVTYVAPNAPAGTSFDPYSGTEGITIGPPPSITASSNADGSVDIAWGPLDGVTRYRVRVAGGYPVTETKTSHHMNPWAANAGKNVTYYVAGFDRSGKLGPETSVTFTVPVPR